MVWDTHRPLSCSFFGLPCRNLNISHKKELLWSLWVLLWPRPDPASPACLKTGCAILPMPFFSCARTRGRIPWLKMGYVTEKGYHFGYSICRRAWNIACAFWSMTVVLESGRYGGRRRQQVARSCLEPSCVGAVCGGFRKWWTPI